MADWGVLLYQAVELVKKGNPEKDINKTIKRMSDWDSKKLKQFIQLNQVQQ